jgi:hypothetical protein
VVFFKYKILISIFIEWFQRLNKEHITIRNSWYKLNRSKSENKLQNPYNLSVRKAIIFINLAFQHHNKSQPIKQTLISPT